MRIKDRKVAKNIIITIVIFIVIGKGALFLIQEKRESLEKAMVTFLQKEMEQAYFMPASFISADTADMGIHKIPDRIIREMLPIYAFAENTVGKEENEDEMMAEFFRQREGSDEDRKDIEEEKLDYGKDALHIENSILEEMERENRAFAEKPPQSGENTVNPEVSAEEAEKMAGQDTKGQVVDGEENDFVIAQYPAYTYDWEEQWGYEELVSNFYAVDASTSLKEEYMNLDELLYRDLSVDLEAEGPQILIYHTHSQEAFADSVEGDASTTIVGAGEKLAKLLSEEYGFKVMHHTGEYDVENRDYAYSNSLPEIERILEENPSIEVVIDLHRDEMQEGKKLLMDLQGRPTARFMFFDGMSYIRNKGEITYLENPYIQDNLAFSFQAQVTANQYYPGIARKIYLKAYRYNLHLCPKSILIELGAQTNTVEEIMNACDPLAHIISIVLNGEV
ncbi:MAG: stage II sporulation protein P [Lachnospiraceae bacterium]|nr:stage II sporulation protein P [Lachnospiraceae bacterium]